MSGETAVYVPHGGGLDHCGMPFSPKGAPLQVLGLVIHWQMGGLALLI